MTRKGEQKDLKQGCNETNKIKREKASREDKERLIKRRKRFQTLSTWLVTTVYTPSPRTFSTECTLSWPDTVMMQSPTDTWEAYTRGRSAGDGDREHVPAGRTWFCVILMSLPLFVVICVKTALSLLAPWGMKTT